MSCLEPMRVPRLMNVRRFQLYKLLLLAALPPTISAPIANMAVQAEMPTVDKRYQEWQLWTQLDGEWLFYWALPFALSVPKHCKVGKEDLSIPRRHLHDDQ